MTLKMPPLWAVTVGYICSIFAICAQIIIGYFGDRIVTRWGKRKPILCVLWPIISIVAVAFLYATTTLKPLEVQAYYLILLVILTVCGNAFQQVYAAWFYESCASQEDYRVVIVYGITAGAGFGSLIGLVGVMMGMVAVMAIIASIGSTVTMAILLWYFPARTVAAASKQPPLLSSVRILSSSPEYITVVLNEIVIGTAMTLGAEFLSNIAFTNFPSYMTHYKQFFVYLMIFAILQAISSVFVSIAMSVLLSRGWEKINMYLGFNKFFMVLSLIFFSLYVPGLIASLDRDTEMFLFFVWLSFVILMILCFSAAQFLRGLIVRDLIRFDTFRSGLNRENMYQTALNVPANIASQLDRKSVV
jgi:MFS family permease